MPLEIAVATQVLMRIEERGADPQRLRELTSALQSDLLGGIHEATLIERDDTAVGTRGFDWDSLGVLLLSIQGSAEAVMQLVTMARSWLRRGQHARKVELTVGKSTLRLDEASDDQQERLIDEFVRAIS